MGYKPNRTTVSKEMIYINSRIKKKKYSDCSWCKHFEEWDNFCGQYDEYGRCELAPYCSPYCKMLESLIEEYPELECSGDFTDNLFKLTGKRVCKYFGSKKLNESRDSFEKGEIMDILIGHSRDKILATKEEFLHFTYYDLACFWCNWKVAFFYDDNGNLKMYTHRYKIVDECINSKYFNDIEWYEIESAEMYFCTIPKGNELIEKIENEHSGLIMR